MTTSAKSGFGTKLQYGDAASPEKFTTVAELINIDPPEMSDVDIDVTSHDSPDATEDINSGCVDHGEIVSEGNFVNDATQTAVRGNVGGAVGNWQLCAPNWGARTKTFTANASTDVVTAAGHALTTGQPVRLTTTDTLPAGLSANTTYWVHYISADTFTLHTTNAGAVADSGKVDITDTGTGTHTVQIGTRLDFAGNVKAFKSNAPLRGALGYSFKIRVTAAVTYS